MNHKNSIVNFLKYNNTVPIVLGVLFLMTGGAMAASPEVRESIYHSHTEVRSIDNSRIISINPDTYPLSVEVTGVREDDENYYLSYVLTTLELVDASWQDTGKPGTMTVAKALLGSKDLGSYVSQQLKEVRDYERERLRQTQVYEKQNGLSQKVIATEYSGLVGQFLDSNEETFEGYRPVAEGKEAEDPNRLETPVEAPLYDPNAVVVSETEDQGSNDVTNIQNGSDTSAPNVSIVGDNPAQIAIGETYTDLGVVVTDDTTDSPTVDISVDGTPVTEVSLDTSAARTYVIRYRATDEEGNTRTKSRTVVIGEGGVVESTPEPEPEPEPEPIESGLVPEPQPEPTPEPAAPVEPETPAETPVP